MFELKRRTQWTRSGRTALYYCIGIYFFSLMLAQPVNAEWTGGVEGGTVVRDSGAATRLRLVLRNDARPFSQYVYAEWLRSNASGNSYSVGYNPRYWFNQTYYTFGESEYRVDKTFGIDSEITLITGLGGQFLKSAQQSLFVELGVGGRSIQFLEADDAQNETLGVARLGYFRTFADSVKFDLSLSSSRSSEDIDQATGEVGLSLRIPSGSLRVAYRSRYQKVGDNDSISDDDTFVSFGYSF